MGSYQIAKIKGIPIKVHITLIVVLPLMAIAATYRMGNAPLAGLLVTLGLFVSIALHELGHSLVARAKGCAVREILLLPIGGMAQMDRIPSIARDEFQMAVAGPAVSLLLALVFSFLGDFLAIIKLSSLSMVCASLSAINFMLALFNLIPSFPMDGGRIFRAWLTPRIGRLEATRLAVKVGRFIAIAMGIASIFLFNVFLLLIAIFIYQAAGAEYRMVLIQEAHRQQWASPWPNSDGRWVYDEQHAHVSPPPYRRGGMATTTIFARPMRYQHDLFDHLFEKWR